MMKKNNIIAELKTMDNIKNKPMQKVYSNPTLIQLGKMQNITLGSKIGTIPDGSEPTPAHNF